MQPTEGKWHFFWRHENGEADCGIFAEPHPGHAIAVARCPRYEKQEQWEANATLMCAASDMLALLKDTVAFLEDECCGDQSKKAAPGSFAAEARKRADSIAALIKQARGEL